MRYYVSTKEASFFIDHVMGIGASAPTVGTYKVGDFIISSTQADGIFGWVCTVAGTPGTWVVIGSGQAGGGGTENAPITLTGYSNIVEFSDARTSVNIGIDEYNVGTDFLEVHYNGLLLVENVHYTLDPEGRRITKIGGQWNTGNYPGQQMLFKVIKGAQGTGSLVQIRKTVTLNESTLEVLTGIPDYNTGSDLMEVHLNGVLLMEGLDYRYEPGKLIKIDTSEAWNPNSVKGQKMFIRVLKNKGNINPTSVDLLDGSITIAKLSPEVIELLNMTEDERIGDMDALETTHKTSVVGAINELFQNANNGKETIATAIGSPLQSSDTFAAMGTKIDSIESKFKTILNTKGVNIDNVDGYDALVDKVNDILPTSSTRKYTMVEAAFDVDGMCTSMNPYVLISQKGEMIIFGGIDDYNGNSNKEKFVLNLKDYTGTVEELSSGNSNLVIPLIRKDEEYKQFAYFTKNNTNSTLTAEAIKIDKTTLTITKTPKFTSESISSQGFCVSLYKHGLVGEHYRSNLNTAVYTYDEELNTWTNQGYTDGGMSGTSKILNEELENGFHAFTQSINGVNGGLIYYDFGTKTMTRVWTKPSNLIISGYTYALRLNDTKFMFKPITGYEILILDISDDSIIKIPSRAHALVIEYKSKFYIYGGKSHHNNPTILNISNIIK